MKIPKRIQGAGGKDGGGSHTPVEATDTLRSRAYARVMDLVCEGPIEGPATGTDNARWVYLDGTPLENADGTKNFTGVSLAWVLGTQSQDYFSSFPESENEIAVSREITNANPQTITVTNSAVNAVRVTVGFPQMTLLNTSNGDLAGNNVTIYIDVDSGGGFINKITDKVVGKCTSLYERSYRVELSGSGPWNIKVRRSADSVSSSDQKKTFFQRYTEIVNTKFSYPNSAIVAMQVDASQFSAIPTRGYRLKLLQVQVPKNYDPITKTYDTTPLNPGVNASGGWDGTFKLAWTDNPAWCYYDLLTSTRYGAGKWVPASKVNKWALYTIGQYCDGFVPTGIKKRATHSTTASLAMDGPNRKITRATGGFWTPKLENTRISVSGHVLTIAGGASSGYDFTKLGFRVGDSVTTTGFNTVANNVTRNITALTPYSMTLDGANLTTTYFPFEYGTITGPAGGNFAVGDEVMLSGFSNAANNGRAVITQLLIDQMYITGRTPVTEAAGSRTIALQDSTEPRFTCNTYLQTQEKAFTVLNNLASVFRGMAYWAAGAVGVVQDAPDTIQAVYTNANVKGGKFSYTGSPLRQRHSVALVQWNDPKNGFKQRTLYVEDRLAVSRYGVHTTTVTAMGCTSQGQAYRLGMWLLMSERTEPEAVSFETDLFGANIPPGALFQVQDSNRAGRVLGGRVEGSVVRRNYALYANKMDDATWTKSQQGTGSNPTVTADYAAGPEPGTVADRVQLALNGGATTSDISQITQAWSGYTANQDSTYAVWMKTTDGSTKTVLLVNFNSQGTAQTVDGTWRQFFLPRTATSTVGSTFGIRLRGGTTSDSADILVYGNQLDKVGDPAALTPFIETTSSPLVGTCEVVVDRPITIENAKTYTLSITQPDGTLATRVLTNQAGDTTNLKFTTPLSSTPVVGAPFILAVNDLQPTTWRLVSITPKVSDESVSYQIEGVAHNTSKFAAVDAGETLVIPVTSSLPSGLPIANLAISEYQIARGVGTVTMLTIDWDGPKDAQSYSVDYRRSDGNWVSIPDVTQNHAEVEDMPNGPTEVRVIANFTGGIKSQATSATYTVIGKVAPPQDVTGFTASWSANGLTLSWSKVLDADVNTYEIRTGASWAAGTPLEGGPAGTGTQVAATTFQWRVPTLPPSALWLKALDTSGNYSVNAATLTPTNPLSSFSGMTLTSSQTRPT